MKPGVINTGASWRRRQVPFPTSSSSTHTCPVINCGRVYDNVPLLEGHLKRLDNEIYISVTIMHNKQPTYILAMSCLEKYFFLCVCRFDHSPCDPTIYLKGSPTELFACVACGLHFETKEAWRVHQQSMVGCACKINCC